MKWYNRSWPFLAIFVVAFTLSTALLVSAQTPGGKAALNVVELRSIATEVAIPDISANKTAATETKGLGAFAVYTDSYGYRKSIVFMASTPLQAGTVITLSYSLPNGSVNYIGAWQFSEAIPDGIGFMVWDGGFTGPWPSGITTFEVAAYMPDGSYNRSYVGVPIYIDDVLSTQGIMGFEQTPHGIAVLGKFDPSQTINVWIDYIPLRIERVTGNKIRIDITDERLNWLSSGEHRVTVQMGETSSSRTIYFTRVQYVQ